MNISNEMLSFYESDLSASLENEVFYQILTKVSESLKCDPKELHPAQDLLNAVNEASKKGLLGLFGQYEDNLDFFDSIVSDVDAQMTVCDKYGQNLEGIDTIGKFLQLVSQYWKPCEGSSKTGI